MVNQQSVELLTTSAHVKIAPPAAPVLDFGYIGLALFPSTPVDAPLLAVSPLARLTPL